MELLIRGCTIVQSFQITADKRDTYEGFIKAEIIFMDDSVLFVREFVSVETTVDRDMYSYQFMDSTNNFIFRYDNTPHHRKLDLPTFPHHKHEGHEGNVFAASAPFLAEVLLEIESMMA
jgi:hypothetical protein